MKHKRISIYLMTALSVLLFCRCEVLDTTTDLEITNNTHTQADVLLNGRDRYYIEPGKTLVLEVEKGVEITYHATSCRKKPVGDCTGIQLLWEETVTPTGKTFPIALDYNTDYVYVRVKNTSNTNLGGITVHYANGANNYSSIDLPNDGITYGTGYFKTQDMSKITAGIYGTLGNVTWTDITPPNTKNQSILLTYDGE